MKVFISWSGELSKEIAAALSEWLPLLNHHIEPFMSSDDIQKGSRWLSHLSKELQDTNYGILCLTPDNVEAPWVCFEAGALAKIIDSSQVAPILFGLQPSDVRGPLAQFQATKFEEEDFRRLVVGIDGSVGEQEARGQASLDKMMDICWPKLVERVAPLVERAASAKNPFIGVPFVADGTEKVAQILEEVLLLARQQAQVLSDPKSLLPQGYLEPLIAAAVRHRSPTHPAWQEVWLAVDRLEVLIATWRVSGLNASDAARADRALRELRRRLDYASGRNRFAKFPRLRPVPADAPPPDVADAIAALAPAQDGAKEAAPPGVPPNTPEGEKDGVA